MQSLIACCLFCTGTIWRPALVAYFVTSPPFTSLEPFFSPHSLTQWKSWQKYDERTEHPSIPKSCKNSYNDHYFVSSSQSTVDKSGTGKGFFLLLILLGDSVGFRFCSFFTAFCGMEHSSLLIVSWDFYWFFFPVMLEKWLIGFLAIILAFGLLL